MSYSVDLWNSYSKVQNVFINNHKGLKNYINLLNENYYGYYQLIETLQKMSQDKSFITNFESIKEGVLCFKGDLINQINYLKELLTSLKEDIITPLTNLQNDLNNKFNANIEEITGINKQYRSMLTQLNVAKNRFHTALKDTEILKLRSEVYLNSDKKENLDDNVVKQNELRLQSSLNFSKNCEKIYLNLINEANRIQDEFIETKKRCLNQIQEMEEELGSSIKSSIKKFIVFQCSYLRNLQYDIDKKMEKAEEMDIKKDINEYIIKNYTSDIPAKKIEYVPKEDDLESRFKDKNIPKNLIIKVSDFIAKEFPHDKSVTVPKTKNQIDIELLTDLVFQSKKLTYEQTQLAINLLLSKRARRNLLREFNNSRIIKGDLINEVSYNIIGELLKETLNLSITEKDFESEELVIILSTSLFKVTKDSNCVAKTFVYNCLSPTVIKDNNFWKRLLKFRINEELHRYKNENFRKTEEDFNDRNKRIKGTVYEQLGRFIGYLRRVEMEGVNAGEIVEFFVEYYDLDKVMVDELNKSKGDGVKSYSSIVIKTDSNMKENEDKSNESSNTPSTTKEFSNEKFPKIQKRNRISLDSAEINKSLNTTSDFRSKNLDLKQTETGGSPGLLLRKLSSSKKSGGVKALEKKEH